MGEEGFYKFYRIIDEIETKEGNYLGLRIKSIVPEKFLEIIEVIKYFNGIYKPETKLWYVRDEFLPEIESILDKTIEEITERERERIDTLLEQKGKTIDEVQLDEEYKELRDIVFVKQKNTCQVCDKEGTIAHHIQPRSFGGENKLRNLVVLCSNCHALLHSLYRKKLAELALKQDSEFFRNGLVELKTLWKKNKNSK